MSHIPHYDVTDSKAPRSQTQKCVYQGDQRAFQVLGCLLVLDTLKSTDQICCDLHNLLIWMPKPPAILTALLPFILVV